MRKNYPITLGQLISEAIKASRKYGTDKYVLLAEEPYHRTQKDAYRSLRRIFQIPRHSDISTLTKHGLSTRIRA